MTLNIGMSSYDHKDVLGCPWLAGQLNISWHPGPSMQANPESTPKRRSIVYLSTAVGPLSTAQLEALLIDAREHNAQTDTTGVLLYGDGKFMQCFEGSEEGMRITYDRIIASGLHKDIVELMNGPIAKRNFGDWQMGYAEPTASELLMLSTAQWELQALWAQGWKVSRGMELLQLFWSRAC
jgi:hypothetical protein